MLPAEGSASTGAIVTCSTCPMTAIFNRVEGAQVTDDAARRVQSFSQPSLLAPSHFVQPHSVLKSLRHELAAVRKQELLPRQQATHCLRNQDLARGRAPRDARR